MNIYTDGACKGNGKLINIGGNGFIIEETNYSFVEINHNTTNNKEEMKAILNSLVYLKENNITEDVNIYSDSVICINGMLCKKNNLSKGRFLKRFKKNLELWEQLHFLHTNNINYIWIKGHNGNKYNEIIDDLINKAIELH